MGKKQTKTSSKREENIKNKARQISHLKGRLSDNKINQTARNPKSQQTKLILEPRKIIHSRAKSLENCQASSDKKCQQESLAIDQNFTAELKKELLQNRFSMETAKIKCHLSKQEQLQNALSQAILQNQTLRLRVAELEAIFVASQQENQWLKETIQILKNRNQEQHQNGKHEVTTGQLQQRQKQQKNKSIKMQQMLISFDRLQNQRENFRGTLRLQQKTAEISLNQDRQAFSNSISINQNMVKQAFSNQQILNSKNQSIPQSGKNGQFGSLKRSFEQSQNNNFPILIKPRRRKIRK